VIGEGVARASPFVPSEARLDLVASVRDVLRQSLPSPTASVDAAAREALWRRIGGLGWVGTAVPEHRGGLGLGFADLCAVLEESGRFVLDAPLAETAVCGLTIERFAPNRGPELLPAIAAGALVGTVAADSACALRSGGTPHLTGEARFVGHGAQADVLVLFAGGGSEPALVLVDGPALASAERRDSAVTDPSRRVAHLRFDGPLAPEAVLARGDEAVQDAAWMRALAAVSLAADCVGGAQRALELATAYARERRQFGRVIGSFQAIKHTLADMLALVEHGRTALQVAASSVDEDHPELVLRAALAKATCGDGFVRVAGDTIQVHGGLGFTWEHPAHRFYKRAVVNSQLGWSTAACREHIRATLFA
jgi:alkylation response protein AidB-like acyl-CoA dehydrogenase